MPRYQLLLGSHIDRDPEVKRRDNETSEEFDQRSFRYFYWNSPEHCIVDTEVDMEAKHNKPGFEKFRKLTDFVVAQPQEIADKLLIEEAVRRGMMSRQQADTILRERQAGGKVTTTQPPTTDQLAHEKSKAPLDSAHVANNREQVIKDTLANLNKMTKPGLESFANDNEIDIAGCKNDDQLRAAIRKHFSNGGK